MGGLEDGPGILAAQQGALQHPRLGAPEASLPPLRGRGEEGAAERRDNTIMLLDANAIRQDAVKKLGDGMHAIKAS